MCPVEPAGLCEAPNVAFVAVRRVLDRTVNLQCPDAGRSLHDDGLDQATGQSDIIELMVGEPRKLDIGGTLHARPPTQAEDSQETMHRHVEGVADAWKNGCIAHVRHPFQYDSVANHCSGSKWSVHRAAPAQCVRLAAVMLQCNII